MSSAHRAAQRRAARAAAHGLDTEPSHPFDDPAVREATLAMFKAKGWTNAYQDRDGSWHETVYCEHCHDSATVDGLPPVEPGEEMADWKRRYVEVGRALGLMAHVWGDLECPGGPVAPDVLDQMNGVVALELGDDPEWTDCPRCGFAEPQPSGAERCRRCGARVLVTSGAWADKPIRAWTAGRAP